MRKLLLIAATVFAITAASLTTTIVTIGFIPTLEYRQVNANTYEVVGVNGLMFELYLAEIFDKLYKMISIAKFADADAVKIQQDCKRNIRTIMSTLMNDVAMPFGVDKGYSIFDSIYIKNTFNEKSLD